MWLVDIFSSGGLGAITGLVGGWLAKKEARKMRELEFEIEKENRKYDLAELKLEHTQQLTIQQLDIELAELEGDMEIASTEADAFLQSIKEQGKSTGNAIFDGFKSMVRPFITFWLLFELSMLSSELAELTGGLKNLPIVDLSTMYLSVVNAIIFLATTATGWWFASRKGQV